MAIDKTKLKHLSNQTLVSGAQGLVSVLDIDGSIYELHDKCVEGVVEELEKVESRVGALEGDVSGFLGDDYDPETGTTLKDIEDTLEELEAKEVEVTDAAVTGKYVTHITKDSATGVISSVKADLNATAVAATKGEDATTVQTWLEEIQALLDTDGGIVKKVQDIVKELEEATNGGASDTWTTLVDKLHGLPAGKTVKEYADSLVEGMVKSVNEITPDENGDVTITAADVNITYIKAGEEKTDSLEDFLDEREQVIAAALVDLDSRIKKGVAADDLEEKSVTSASFAVADNTLKITTTTVSVLSKAAATGD